ncbi:hypothetical protein [Enterococcus sp. 5H]|uniref:hypothetical protein n=1 Tax=Enterococcus sp. 5H TaxID=1229490 RepID=UPI002303A575|nr:hypothetical protein [Enterococcus sp. 5H]MDA9471847.1 hypothetical protein [Enterococcus sp. 5H]
MIKGCWSNSSNVKKVIYLAVIVGSVGICFVGIDSSANQRQQRKIEYAKATIENEAVKIKRLDTKIIHFYQDGQEEFLIDPIDMSSVEAVEKDIASLKTTASDFGLKDEDFSIDNSEVSKEKKALVDKISDIKNKQAIQGEISALLVQSPTKWTKENLDIVISEDTTLEKITSISGKITKSEKSWNVSMMALLKEIEMQVTQYNALKQSIDAMIVGEELTTEANLENFISSYNQLELIKNETLRNRLNSKLETIDQLLNEQAMNHEEIPSEEVLPAE